MMLTEFRDQFEIVRHRRYLFNGAVTPPARRVLEASRDWQAQWETDPLAAYKSYSPRRQQLRASIAELLGCTAEEVAITDNASRGSHLAIRLLAARAGDHVVVDPSTYPSSRYGWLAMTDKKLRHVPAVEGTPIIDSVIASISAQTAAVSVSHVSYHTGARYDLGRLATAAHAQGAMLIVDASQSAGAVAIDVAKDDVDILVGTCGKWLLAGPGVGFMYVKRELIESTSVLEPGWMNLDAGGFSWPMDSMPPTFDDARRFEPGTPNLNGMVLAQAGIDVILELGLPAIESKIATLVTRARNGLLDRGLPVWTPEPAGERAGILAFPDKRASALAAYVKERRIDIGGYGYGLVRIDPHAFNVEDEIDVLLEGIDDFTSHNRGEGQE